MTRDNRDELIRDLYIGSRALSCHLNIFCTNEDLLLV